MSQETKSHFAGPRVTQAIFGGLEQQSHIRDQTLRRLGLDSVAAVKAYRPVCLIKDHKQKRDISRIEATFADGEPPITLYLKRLWRVPKKDAFQSLLRYGRVRSASHQEWLNYKALLAAGISGPEVIAVGAEMGLLWERFSFILTSAAVGEPVEDFLHRTRGQNSAIRRDTLRRLAAFVRRMHDAGCFPPDLFTRHIFVANPGSDPGFSIIDVARLTISPRAPDRLRARSLAALNVTASLADVTRAERLRFLLDYDADGLRLVPRIRRRSLQLLKRRAIHRYFTQA